MHGLGLRSSSHGIQAPGQASIETFGACPRAIAATKTERAHFQVTPSAMQPVIDRFGDEVRQLVRYVTLRYVMPSMLMLAVLTVCVCPVCLSVCVSRYRSIHQRSWIPRFLHIAINVDCRVMLVGLPPLPPPPRPLSVWRRGIWSI